MVGEPPKTSIVGMIDTFLCACVDDPFRRSRDAHAVLLLHLGLTRVIINVDARDYFAVIINDHVVLADFLKADETTAERRECGVTDANPLLRVASVFQRDLQVLVKILERPVVDSGRVGQGVLPPLDAIFV